MDRIKGQIMSKAAFLDNNVPYTKEPYEGILISADNNNQYKIAIQLSENQVLVVDQVSDREVQESVREWVPRVNEIQVQYGVQNDLENYSQLQN